MDIVGLFHDGHQCWYDIEIDVVTNSAVEGCRNIHSCLQCHALTVPKEEVMLNEPCIFPSTQRGLGSAWGKKGLVLRSKQQ